MDVELIEIREFLAGRPPFDQLCDELLDKLPRELTVRYLRRGTPFPPQDAEQACLYVIRKGAIELRNDRDELVAKYGEGDIYASACLPDDPIRGLRGTTVEDSLLYLLPGERLQALREADENFDAYFTQSLRDRLRRAREILNSSGNGSQLLTIEVGRLIKRAPVTVTADTSIQEAAQIMTRERISSLLIMENGALAGMITDRDLRSRCIAQGVATTRPVSEIMTRNLHKVTPDTPAFEVLISMTRHKIHHLPVVSRNGVEGIVTATDLIRYQSTNSIYAVDSVRKCNSVEDLIKASAVLPELQIQMVASGASAHQLGQAVSSVTDAITVRLIELAESRFGPPPVPYAWLAGGSQGRREQTVHSDQDNALLLSDDAASEHDAYFSTLANFVNDGLNACGFVYCPGEVMARNPKWRQPYRVWRAYFDEWIARADRKSAMLAVNFFDTRVVYGDEMLHARLLADARRQAAENTIFLAYLGAHAMASRPPLGFFRHLVLITGGEHAKALDLKRGAIIPLTDIARLQALAAGLPEINTIERLRAAADAKAISPELAANLEDAYEFIATLRARHQARQIKKGEPPDNYIKPAELSALERTHLKDVFAVIRSMQNTIAQRHQTSRLL